MSASEKKFAAKSFLDQIDDEDVLAAILKLRRHGKSELLPVKDETPVLHRLLDHSVKLVDEQRPLENKRVVKNQYVDELDDDDVFEALQAMQRKMPPHMKALYREIDLNHQRREESQLILPPSMRKYPVAGESEDGKVDDSLDEVPRVDSFNTLLQQTQSSKNSSTFSRKSRGRVATGKQYDMPEQETSIETDEIAFKQILRNETEEAAAEAVAGVSLRFDGVFEWKVVSAEEKAEEQEVEAQDLSQGQDHQIERPKRRGFFKKIMSAGNYASAAASKYIEPENPLLQVEDSQECELVNSANDVQDENPRRRRLSRKMLSVGNLAHTASDESATWQAEETREMAESRGEPDPPHEDHEIETPLRLGLLRRSSRSSVNLATADVQESSSWQVESVQQSEASREAALTAYVQDVILPARGRHRSRKPKLRTVLRGIRVAASRANPFAPGDSDEEDDSSHVEDEEISHEVFETENAFDTRSVVSLLDQDHDLEKPKGLGLLKRIMKASRSRANSFVSDENHQEEDSSQVKGDRQREVPETEKDKKNAVSLLDQEQENRIEKPNRRGLLKKMLSSSSLAAFVVGPEESEHEDSPFQVERDQIEKPNRRGLLKKLSSSSLATFLGPYQSEHESSPFQVEEDLRRDEVESKLVVHTQNDALSPGESHHMKKSKKNWLVKRVRSTGDLASVWAHDQHDQESVSYQLDEDQRRVAAKAAVSDCGASSPYESHLIKTQIRRWLVNSAKTIDNIESTGAPNQSDLGPELRSFDSEDVHTQARRQSKHPRQMEQLRNRWRSVRKEFTAGKPHEEADDEESRRAEMLAEKRSLENQETIPSFDEKHEKSPGHVTRLKKLLQTRKKQSSGELVDHVEPEFLPRQYKVTHAGPSLSFDGALSSQRSNSLISEICQKGALEHYDNVRYGDECEYFEKKNARRLARLNEQKSNYPHSVHAGPNLSCGAATGGGIESKVLRETDLVCGDGNASAIKSTARPYGLKAKTNHRGRSHSFLGGRAVYRDDLIPYSCSGSSTRERASDHPGDQIFDRILDYFEEKIGCQNEGDDDESFAESSLAFTAASTVDDEKTVAI
jgi:hypothetical protein